MENLGGQFLTKREDEEEISMAKVEVLKYANPKNYKKKLQDEVVAQVQEKAKEEPVILITDEHAAIKGRIAD